MEEVKPRTHTEVKREVVTEEKLQEELKDLLETMMAPWIKENEVNFASVILASMGVIEQYTVDTKGLKSSDKLKYAIKLIPQIIDYCVKAGKLTEKEAEDLKNKIEYGTDVVEQIISVYVMIAKHPAVVDFHEDVHEFFEEKCGCFGKSFHTKKAVKK